MAVEYRVFRDNKKKNYRIKFGEPPYEKWVSYLEFNTLTRFTRTWKSEKAALNWIEDTKSWAHAVENRFEEIKAPRSDK